MGPTKTRRNRKLLRMIDARSNGERILLLFLWGLIGFALWDAALLAETVSDALRLCITRIVPVLFPIAAAGGLLTCLSPPKWICRPIGRLFRLEDASVGVLLIALISGFPIGAMLSSRLLEAGRISREEASRLASYTNNASAAFLTGCVGASFFGDRKIGWILWGISTISALTVGILMAQEAPRPPAGARRDAAEDASPSAAEMAEALKRAGHGMLYLTVFVVFFAVICKFEQRVLLLLLPRGAGAEIVQAITAAFLEITGGLAAIARLPLALPLRMGLAGAAAGWGGLSVFLQCVAVGSAVDGKRLWRARSRIGFLSGILALLIGFIG